jgi:protein O-GlcNAc transferase
LPREIFEVTVLFVQPLVSDAFSRRISAAADHTLLLPRGLGDTCEAIAELQLDILFFQEIGMDPFSYFLAHARLAPQQCTFFGHPDTTGISTIDTYLSAQHSEPVNGEDHYTERLMLLPHLAIPSYYERSPIAAVKTREQLGLPQGKRLYGCLQTLFKIHPDMDDVFTEILVQDPEGELILVEALRNPHLTELLRNRITGRHPETAGRVRFLPYRVGDYFLSLAAACDVTLDPFHFGGMNSTLDSFQVGTPVITLPGEFQRGRQTLAMYQRMGISDCVASNPQDYAARAVSIAKSSARGELSRLINDRTDRVFADHAVVSAFTDCLQRLAQ